MNKYKAKIVSNYITLQKITETETTAILAISLINYCKDSFQINSDGFLIYYIDEYRTRRNKGKEVIISTNKEESSEMLNCIINALTRNERRKRLKHICYFLTIISMTLYLSNIIFNKKPRENIPIQVYSTRVEGDKKIISIQPLEKLNSKSEVQIPNKNNANN